MLAAPGRNHVHLSLSKNALDPYRYVTPYSLPRRRVIPVAISSRARARAPGLSIFLPSVRPAVGHSASSPSASSIIAFDAEEEARERER